VERAELSLRIDRFLQRAPAPAFSAEAFARFRADPVRQAMVERVLHPETLATLREASKLTKTDTAAALADRLELGGHELAVKARYHDLEAGNTNPARVRLRVWEALAEILKAPADKLRTAAETVFGGEQAMAPAFARTAFLSYRHLERPAPQGDGGDKRSGSLGRPRLLRGLKSDSGVVMRPVRHDHYTHDSDHRPRYRALS